MKEDSDRKSEPAKGETNHRLFRIRLWAVEFLSKFQPDPTDGSKVTPLFVQHAQDHIASVYVYVYVYMYMCICICICVYMYMCVYVYVNVYVYVYVYMYMYMYMYICIC